MTRVLPVSGPTGSTSLLSSYGAYQSPTHSQTLPTTSMRPYRDLPSGKEPTGAVVGHLSSAAYIPSSGNLCVLPQATHSEPHAFKYFALGSSSPHGYLLPSGPRAANSHSASV